MRSVLGHAYEREQLLEARKGSTCRDSRGSSLARLAILTTRIATTDRWLSDRTMASSKDFSVTVGRRAPLGCGAIIRTVGQHGDALGLLHRVVVAVPNFDVDAGLAAASLTAAHRHDLARRCGSVAGAIEVSLAIAFRDLRRSRFFGGLLL